MTRLHLRPQATKKEQAEYLRNFTVSVMLNPDIVPEINNALNGAVSLINKRDARQDARKLMVTRQLLTLFPPEVFSKRTHFEAMIDAFVYVFSAGWAEKLPADLENVLGAVTDFIVSERMMDNCQWRDFLIVMRGEDPGIDVSLAMDWVEKITLQAKRHHPAYCKWKAHNE